MIKIFFALAFLFFLFTALYVIVNYIVETHKVRAVVKVISVGLISALLSVVVLIFISNVF